MSETHANYLRDLGFLVREAAVEAKAEAESSASDFEAGRRLAYYEIVSLMQARAFAFNLPLRDLALEGFDPDRDLF